MDSSVLSLLAGLLLVVKGGDLFVAALRIAVLLRMPKVVVGSTIVSLATTTPELVVSCIAGLRGESGLAVGNAVGSCICNLGLILGTTALLKEVRIHFNALRVPLLSMTAACILLLLATWSLQLDRWQAVGLVGAGAAYFILDFWRHWNCRDRAEIREAEAIEAGVSHGRWPWLDSPAGAGGRFLLGALVVILGSRLLVDGAVALATRMGVPSIVVGLTVVAIGTSLPEIITAVGSARRSVSDLAVGNVLGANIANLTFIVGMAGLFGTVRLDRATQLSSFPVLLLLAGLVGWSLRTRQRLSRVEGFVLVGVYLAYLVLQVMIFGNRPPPGVSDARSGGAVPRPESAVWVECRFASPPGLGQHRTHGAH
jgi:cation:H+ antiporter